MSGVGLGSGWRKGRNSRPGVLRTGTSADLDHLIAFAQSRGGVEAYLEPRTAVTETTIVLVASTGEWTRRRVPGIDAARAFAQKHAIPLYEVAIVGYPQRMRDWTAQRKAAGQLGPPSSEGSPA
jgi:hypothetical protein